jgi:hypothetical protein
MLDVNWLMVIRQINILLGFIGIGLLSYRLWQMRGAGLVRPEQRFFILAVLVYIVAAQFGTIEAWRGHFPWGYRIPVITLAHVWMIYATLHAPSPEYQKKRA